MLSTNKYSKNYIGSSRNKVELQFSAYKNLVSAIRKVTTGTTNANTAIKNLEPIFFNHLMFALDYYFVHRSRTLELNERNPLNEVRIL